MRARGGSWGKGAEGTRPGQGGGGGSEGSGRAPHGSPRHGRGRGGAGESGSSGTDARPKPGRPAPSPDPSPARSAGGQEAAASPHHQCLPAHSQPRETRHEPGRRTATHVRGPEPIPDGAGQ